MLKFRKRMCEEVNAKFSQNWSVELDSAWELEDTRQTLESRELEKEPSDKEDKQDDLS